MVVSIVVLHVVAFEEEVEGAVELTTTIGLGQIQTIGPLEHFATSSVLYES